MAVSCYFFEKLHGCVQLFLVLGLRVKGRVMMGSKGVDKELQQRILSGKIRRQDVARRLGELAFGRVNDCVRLVLEEEPKVAQLDLSLLSEVKRNNKGMVEVKLVDRLQALELLGELAGEEEGDMDTFLKALQGGGEG